MNIQNIVFDVGNVLFRYEPEKVVKSVLPGSAFHSLYLDSLLNSSVWQKLDRGDYTVEEALLQEPAFSSFSSSQKEDLRLLVNSFVHHLDLIEASKMLFLKSSKRYNTYILSNFQADPFDVLLEHHPFLKQAKGMVVSAKEKYKKPEPEIYSILLDRYRLNPEHTVFIDDLEENIHAAEAFGIRGIVFQNSEQVEHALVKLGLSL